MNSVESLIFLRLFDLETLIDCLSIWQMGFYKANPYTVCKTVPAQITFTPSPWLRVAKFVIEPMNLIDLFATCFAP